MNIIHSEKFFYFIKFSGVYTMFVTLIDHPTWQRIISKRKAIIFAREFNTWLKLEYNSMCQMCVCVFSWGITRMVIASIHQLNYQSNCNVFIYTTYFVLIFGWIADYVISDEMERVCYGECVHACACESYLKVIFETFVSYCGWSLLFVVV